jgi:hypothetical protein
MLRNGLLLPTVFCLVVSFPGALSSCAQQAARQYKAAQSILKAHTSEDGVLNDDSHQARAALSQMWGAVGEALIEIVSSYPAATPQQIDEELCKQGIAAAGCDESFSPQHDIIQLGKGLYAVAVATDTGGTVLIVGNRNGKPAQLWSIAETPIARQHDPHDLIGAWLPDRTGLACREEKSGHKPGSCGPTSN